MVKHNIHLTKKGGMNKKKDIYNTNWESPHVPGKQDCCLCVFHFMGLINDDEYIELYNKYSDTGMYPKQIESFFKSKYPHFKFNLMKLNLTKMDKNKVSLKNMRMLSWLCPPAV